MNYTNSSMVTCTLLSPNYNVRRATDEIDRITIHHMAGKMTAKRCGELFLPTSRGGSSNYGVGYDCSVGLYVEEKNRAWTSSNRENDFRAVTIEVSNSACNDLWPVSDDVLNTTINLCVDICRRYGKKGVIEITDAIEGLKWKDAKDRVAKQTAYANGYKVPEGYMLLTQHIYFDTTACPGPYVRSKWKYIAQKINAILGNNAPIPVAPPVAPVINPTPAPTVNNGFVDGERIVLKPGATYANGGKIPDWVTKTILYYRGVSKGDIVKFSTLKTGAITGTININNIEHYGTPVSKDVTVAKPTLVIGNSGAEVKILQNNLVAAGFGEAIKATGGCDGVYGSGTYTAVEQFQIKAFPNQKGEWDGKYGPKTAAALKEWLSK